MEPLTAPGDFRTPDVAPQFLRGGENGLSHSLRWREHRLPHLRAHCKFHDIRSSGLGRVTVKGHGRLALGSLSAAAAVSAGEIVSGGPLLSEGEHRLPHLRACVEITYSIGALGKLIS
jgi:hypothetical protein